MRKYPFKPGDKPMYLSFTPILLQNLFSDLQWRMQGKRKEIYLSFDDGPIPEVTPWVLQTLKDYNAKATFFCVGQNIERNPGIFHQIKEEGHSIGNHSYSHVSGWKTHTQRYIKNVHKGAIISGSRLFRPPYGRIRPSQIHFLKQHYKIVMWDVLSGDFDPNLSAENCYKNVIKNTRDGSIIVFHDSLKSAKKLMEVLPKVLDYYSQRNFIFKSIEPSNIIPQFEQLPALELLY